MMRSIVSLAAVAVCVGTLSMMIYASSAVGCEIRTIRNEMGTSLNAIISGSGPVSGTYVFNVSSDSGEAVKAESGKFTITSASPTEIKKASLDLEPNKGYRASLKIEWPNGSSSCSSSVS
jgi:hypothetical protein